MVSDTTHYSIYSYDILVKSKDDSHPLIVKKLKIEIRHSSNFIDIQMCQGDTKLEIRPNVYIQPFKGHAREPENVAFMSSCPLYTD